ncbi:MAG: DUF4112 domain-containing protein [Nitrospiraceae bacterium]
MSEILDSAFAIPGTRFRIGLDGIIGLIRHWRRERGRSNF